MYNVISNRQIKFKLRIKVIYKTTQTDFVTVHNKAYLVRKH